MDIQDHYIILKKMHERGVLALAVEDVMIDVMRFGNLKSGDIAPEQQVALDEHIDAIIDIIFRWMQQNMN